MMTVTRLSAPGCSARRRVPLPVMCRWIVDPAKECLPLLRREIADFAQRSALLPEEIDASLLIVNELVSNVIDHARTTCRVTVRVASSKLRIFVSDYSSAGPVLRGHDAHALRGRGIQIVAGLAHQWGWSRQRGGKTVWVSINRVCPRAP